MTSIIFFGTDDFAATILSQLLQESSVTIAAVVTKPDRKQGRGRRLQKPPVAAMIPDGIDLLQPEKLNLEFLNTLRAYQADLFVVVAYGKLLPKELLDIPPMKTWNIHPSLLPQYRGPSPIASAILAGDQYTGTTIMELDEEMDHGPIFTQQKIAIESKDTTNTLRQKLATVSGDLLLNTLDQVINQGLKPTEQDHGQATYTHKHGTDDYALDFTQSAKSVLRKIRTFSGEAWFMLPNGKRCKVFEARIVNNFPDNLPTGHLYCQKQGCSIICDEQAIELASVQIEGKQRIDGKSFANGMRHQKT